MWSLLPRSIQLTIIIGASILFARSYEVLAALWTTQTPGIFSIISSAVTFVGTVLVTGAGLFWQWFWRKLPGLNRIAFPDLNGTWRGKVISTWVDPETGVQVAAIDTTITIRQGLFSTSVSLNTGESTSYSTRVVLERFPERHLARIWYAYTNDPAARVRHRSASHDGVAFLEMDLSNLKRLTGRYYTERKTTGDMEVRRL